MEDNDADEGKRKNEGGIWPHVSLRNLGKNSVKPKPQGKKVRTYNGKIIIYDQQGRNQLPVLKLYFANLKRFTLRTIRANLSIVLLQANHSSLIGKISNCHSPVFGNLIHLSNKENVS